MNYYIVINGLQQGPFPADQLLTQGVSPDTLVWAEGMPNWVKASEVPELSVLFAPINQGYQQPGYQQPQPFQQPQYAQPQYASSAQPVKRNNGLGTAGFVLSIVGAVFGWVPFLGWILLTLALIFSIIGVAKKNVKKGLATAGLIITIIAIIAYAILYIVVYNKATSYSSWY